MLEDLSEHASLLALDCHHVTRLLSEHLTTQGAAAIAVPPLAKLFASQTASYLELMVSDDGTAVAAMTLGRGSQFSGQIKSLLRYCEIEAAAADRILAVAAALGHGRALVRLTLVSGGCPQIEVGGRPQVEVGGGPQVEVSGCPQLEVSVCYRRAMHLDHGLRLIDADAASSSEVRGFADLLHKSAISGVTLTVRRGVAAVQHAVHFAQVVTERRREQLRLRLAHAVSRYAPCAAAVSCWAEHHDALLSRERRLLTVAFAPASAGSEAQVSIEYADVSAQAAGRLLAQRAPQATERFARLCAHAGCGALSYLEVGLRQAEAPLLHGYACVG